MNPNTGAIKKNLKKVKETQIKEEASGDYDDVNMMGTSYKYPETANALRHSSSMLNIHEFMVAVQFQMDHRMFYKCWQSITNESADIAIDDDTLEWMGYESQSSFIQQLKQHKLSYRTKKVKKNYDNIKKEDENLSAQENKEKITTEQKKIILKSRDFKTIVDLGLENVKQYYSKVETLFEMYREYLSHFNLRHDQRTCKEEKIQEDLEDLTLKMKDLSTENKTLKTKNTELIIQNDELARQNDEMQHLKDDLIIENNLLKRELAEILNKTAELERQAGYKDITLRTVREVTVPKAKKKSKGHLFALIKRSKDYVYEKPDPEYVKDSDILAIRCQKVSYNKRLKEIRSYGNNTNSDATPILAFESPNSINLFVRVKEKHPREFIYHAPCGIELIDKQNDEDKLINICIELHNERMEYPYI